MPPRTDSPTITPPLGQLKPVDPTPSALQLKPVPGLTGGNQSALLKSNLPIAQASEGRSWKPGARIGFRNIAIKELP